MTHDAIVIGAGLSGLAAALRLALFGRRVVVLERHSLWGGLNSFYTLAGRAFDVGLHALTNWAPARPAPGAPRPALTRLLRALRLRHEELHLVEQGFSEIRFPGAHLRFSNDPAELEAEVARLFPAERDGFAGLVARVRAHEPREEQRPWTSARAVLEGHLAEPLLREMLCLPVFFYGSPSEDDLDWPQFAILFRALFLEGLCRPEGGIRTLLNLLVRRAKQAGVELRLQAGVRRILVAGGAARGVELESGETLEAPVILSSAGRVETLRLAGAAPSEREIGRLSFLESIWILARPTAELGFGAATAFYSTRERCQYRCPSDLVDTGAGVLSSSDNFAGSQPRTGGELRISVLANHARWSALAGDEYRLAKERAADEAAERAGALAGDWRAELLFRDVFTPRTIERFTGHAAGAVYGSPRKALDGRSGIPGLYLIGTDQGYLGVIGALTSGVLMANRHVLQEQAASA